ncbi:redoxin domain-containing protein [Saccharicrinis sp. 156]|uniref:redoxin domain-containing protein n=1 Tax=Saccharicrinis sp. 156 TaxID=3417574 RepID=UPI003D331C85
MSNYIKTLAVITLAVLFSCTPKPNTCIIKGQLTGGDGELVIYPYQQVHSKEEADSLSFKTTIVDGKFELELDAEIANRNMYVTQGKNFKRLAFFSEPGIITVSEKDGNLVAEGSKVNDNYQNIMEELDYSTYQNIQYKKQLSPDEKKVKDGFEAKLWKAAKAYPKSIPLTYFFFQKYWGADVTTLKKVLNTFSKDIHNSYYLNDLNERYKTELKTAVGQPAPEFNLTSLDGEEISISKYKGKYLLIDFWASWCGPCRKAIPGVKEVYEEYHTKGLEIVNISTDAEKKAWLKAVEQEQMPWTQVRDTNGVSEKYNVTAIPHILLISPEGKILAKQMHGAEKIREALKEAGLQ